MTPQNPKTPLVRDIIAIVLVNKRLAKSILRCLLEEVRALCVFFVLENCGLADSFSVTEHML